MADATTEGPRALDVDLDAAYTKPVGYFENEDYRPDPLSQYGTLDTSDTAGGAHQSIREISPVFEEARVANLQTAARALDPDDPTPEELVVLPAGSVTVTGSARTAEDGRGDIERALKRAAENPIELGAAGPEAQKAAEDTSDDGRQDSDQDGVPDSQERSSDLKNPAGARNEGTSRAATNTRRTGNASK